MEQSCAPPAVAPESGLGVSGDQVTRSRDGRLEADREITTTDAIIEPLEQVLDGMGNRAA
jgi:hypothetical protein